MACIMRWMLLFSNKIAGASRYKRQVTGMEKQSIAVLKKLFQTGNMDEDMIKQLKSDQRKGVRTLIENHERQKQKEQELEEHFAIMCRYEETCYDNGCRFVAGIDEAGRGPLAGPVVAASVILPKDFKLLGLNDSKQLNEQVRDTFFSIIKEQAISYGIAFINNQTIDQINIYEATKLAMYKSFQQLDPTPDHVLIDAVSLNQLPCTSDPIEKGDQKSISIAAASILAKVARDHLMIDLHKTYPQYGFHSNMGYGTKHHLEMLNKHGITPVHRISYAPVRNAANK